MLTIGRDIEILTLLNDELSLLSRRKQRRRFYLRSQRDITACGALPGRAKLSPHALLEEVPCKQIIASMPRLRYRRMARP